MAFDKWLSDEQILSMSRLKDIRLFMSSFFAALFSKDGPVAIQHLSKFKKSTGLIIVNIKIFDDFVRVSFQYDYAGFNLPCFVVLNEQHLLFCSSYSASTSTFKDLAYLLGTNSVMSYRAMCSL